MRVSTRLYSLAAAYRLPFLAWRRRRATCTQPWPASSRDLSALMHLRRVPRSIDSGGGEELPASREIRASPPTDPNLLIGRMCSLERVDFSMRWRKGRGGFLHPFGRLSLGEKRLCDDIWLMICIVGTCGCWKGYWKFEKFRVLRSWKIKKFRKKVY